MDIEKVMIGLLLGCLVFLGLYAVLVDFQVSYNFETSQEFDHVYAEVNTTITNMTRTSRSMQDEIVNSTSTRTSGLDNGINAAFSTLKLLGELPALMYGMINAFALTAGLSQISTWLLPLIGTIAVIGLAFALIYLLTGRRPY